MNTVPTNRRKLTIEQAASKLFTSGMFLSSPTTELVNGQFVTTYSLAHPGGVHHRMSVDDVRALVYSNRE